MIKSALKDSTADFQSRDVLHGDSPFAELSFLPASSLHYVKIDNL